MPKKKKTISKSRFNATKKKFKILKRKSKKIEIIENKTIIKDNKNNLYFGNFVPEVIFQRNKTPVLERITEQQPKSIFVGESPKNNLTFSRDKEEDKFKYVSEGNEEEKPKYFGSDSNIPKNPEHFDFSKAGRESLGRASFGRETSFMQSSEIKYESPNIEKRWTSEKIDIEKLGRKNFFEAEQEKNKVYKTSS